MPTGGQIIHKETGQIIPIHKQQSNYVMHLWPNKENKLSPQDILTGNTTYILDEPNTPPTNNDEENQDDEQMLKSTFARLGAK